MAKATFSTSTSNIQIGGNTYHLSELQVRQIATEINATDTETAPGFTDIIAGRRQLECVATFFKDINQQNLTVGNSFSSVGVLFEGYVYSGTAILLELEDVGRIDEAIIQRMRFKFTGTYANVPLA